MGRNLAFTILLGVVSLVEKFSEYRAKFYHGFFPNTDTYFGLYYSLTGLHGMHVLAGIGVLAWLRTLMRRQLFSTSYHTPVEVGRRYWHLVNII